MPDPIVALATAQGYLGNPADPESKITTLLDAISAEIRRITRRAFEGTPTVYDEVYPVDGTGRLTLPHVPVADVLAIRRVYFDGTEAAIYDPTDVVGGLSTTLAAAAAIGDTNLKVDSVSNVAVGDLVRVGAIGADSTEVVRVTVVGTAGAGGSGLTVEPALRYAHALAAVVVEVLGSVSWRIDDLDRGHIVLASQLADYARATYRVTGAIPADVVQICLDWLKTRYEEDVSETSNPPDQQELASQSSDSWSESYIQQEATSIARRPPPSVVRVLAGYYHATGGGPV
jgi:hypothetical protein